ncbi:MAG: hypothetical protein ABII81_03285 [Pseudomonadota bacterium]
MIKIGNRRLLIAETLIVPDGEHVEVTYNITETDLLKVRLIFLHDVEIEKSGKVPAIRCKYEDGWFVLEVCNIKSSLGTHFPPFEMALSDKKESISCSCAAYKFQSAIKTELQIELEEMQ